MGPDLQTEQEKLRREREEFERERMKHELYAQLKSEMGGQQQSSQPVQEPYATHLAPKLSNLPMLGFTADASVKGLSYDVINKNGVEGLLLHIDFSVSGMKGDTGEVAVYFAKMTGWLSDEDLVDRNNLYKTEDGKVAVCDYYRPTSSSQRFNDFQLFIPLSEFHVPTRNVEFRMLVRIYSDHRNRLADKMTKFKL